MKVAYTSDTHLDFWVKDVNPQSPKTKKKIFDFIQNILKPKEADVLLVAGDIGHYNKQNMIMLEMLNDFYGEVIVVNGNHDMYLVSKNIQKEYHHMSHKRTDELKQMCQEAGIHHLDGEVIEIKGTKFGGTGMWYDLPTDNDLYDWKEAMNDSRLIMNGPVHRYKNLGGWNMYSSPTEVIEPSFKTQFHYEKEVKKLDSISDIDVFVSHVCPVHIPDYIKDQRYGVTNKYNKFYESDNLQLLQATGTKYAIFGHTHIEAEFELGGIQFKASAVGYPQERKTSGEIKVFEV